MKRTEASDGVEARRSNVLAFAVTIGLLVFFITGELEGGLTGLQGFFAGLLIALSLHLLLGLLEQRQGPTSLRREEELQIPSHLLVTQSEGTGDISIQIHLERRLLNKTRAR